MQNGKCSHADGAPKVRVVPNKIRLSGALVWWYRVGLNHRTGGSRGSQQNKAIWSPGMVVPGGIEPPTSGL